MKLQKTYDDRPIGIFDSGVGGLTVMEEVIQQLPEENILYLGDTARVPYGIRSAETVTRYSLEMSDILIAKGIKLLVVACNTASAFALNAIKERFDVPVIGVIRPGAKRALEATQSRKIGIIGTEGTIRSNSYVHAINDLYGSLITDGDTPRRSERKPGAISKFIRHFFSACPGESDRVISPAIFSASL